MASRELWVCNVLLCALLGVACSEGRVGDASVADGGGSTNGGESGSGGKVTFIPSEDELPAAGNPEGKCEAPAEAQLEDSSNPDRVVGTGTAASCTSDAFVTAVEAGGVITFDCGPEPVTITLDRTAKIFNDTGPKIVIDGKGLVTLSGGGKRRILYMNTCDEAQRWTTSHCDDQDHPQLTLQNLTFVNGNSIGLVDAGGSPEGGGAIYASGGRLKIINSRFFANMCDPKGPDVGGAGVRAFQQFENKPLYVVNSTFGGSEELANSCSNGAGLSSIGVSYTVINSYFAHNETTDTGGGGGGGIYNDGNEYTLTLCGTKMERNRTLQGGGAIFYVSNDGSGTLKLQDSTFVDNPSDGFETDGFPGIFVKTDQPVQVSGTTFE